MTAAAGLPSAPVGNASGGRAPRGAMGLPVSAIPSLRIFIAYKCKEVQYSVFSNGYPR